MQIKKNLEILEASPEFKAFLKEVPDSFLAHVFRLFDEANENIWQFGYYCPNDTITTFMVDNTKVNKLAAQEIFKKEKTKISQLDISAVKIAFSKAMESAEKIRSEKYSSHVAMKSFAILQVIGGVQVYNITIVTKSFHTLNIRIKSDDGSIVSEQLTSLMDIAKFEKGQGGKEKQDYVG